MFPALTGKNVIASLPLLNQISFLIISRKYPKVLGQLELYGLFVKEPQPRLEPHVQLSRRAGIARYDARVRVGWRGLNRLLRSYATRRIRGLHSRRRTGEVFPCSWSRPQTVPRKQDIVSSCNLYIAFSIQRSDQNHCLFVYSQEQISIKCQTVSSSRGAD